MAEAEKIASYMFITILFNFYHIYLICYLFNLKTFQRNPGARYEEVGQKCCRDSAVRTENAIGIFFPFG